MIKNPWFKCWKPNPDADVNLFCFPHAGGGSLTFKSWAEHTPDSLQIICAQIPGRETRLGEPRLVSIEPIVAGLLEGARPYLDKRFVFFGHSLGSLVCFELARALRREGLPQPFHLFVSGRRAPHIPTEIPISRLSEEDFIAKLRQYNGTPPVLFENPGIMKFFLPTLRADFQVSDDYVYNREDPFRCPLSLYHGREDELAEIEKILAWQEHTNGNFEFKVFPGDHFYINDQSKAILESIAGEIF